MRNYLTGLRTQQACYGFGVAALAVLAGCTSSNTATGLQSNQGYDSSYRDPTRSSTNFSEGTTSSTPTEPVYTMMVVGTEEGTIFPGEEYAVFAVADIPDRGGIEYVWSCTNGDLSELPQADRGRIQALIEAEDAAIRSGAAATTGSPPPPGDSTAPLGSGDLVPPAIGPDGAGGAAPAPGATLPTPGGVIPTPVTPPAPIGKGDAATDGAPRPVSEAPKTVHTLENLSREQRQAPENIQQLYLKQLNNEALTAEETEALRNYATTSQNPNAASAQRRFVGNTEISGPAARESEAAGAEAEELAEQALDAARSELNSFRDAGGPAANVADGPAAEGPDYSDDEDFTPSGRTSLRDEYGTWTDEAGNVRRRGLGGSLEEDSEALVAEESYEAMSFVTDTPYVLWTPSRQGDTILYCKLVRKEVDLTDPVALEAEVILREPTVEISTEFPDIIREDENVLIRLDGENIPDFKKGLFTLEYDPDVLSFREAELGEFFDDAAASSIYYAEPDKSAGRALLAIDSNTEIAELSGDGPLAYVRFKAKRDISTQEETALALTLDGAARYVLDRDGDNILPVPVPRNPLRSVINTPPAQPNTVRDAPPPTTPVGATGPAAMPTTGAPLAPTGAAAPVNPGAGMSPRTQTPLAKEENLSRGLSADSPASDTVQPQAEVPVAPLSDGTVGPAPDDAADKEAEQPVGPQPTPRR